MQAKVIKENIKKEKRRSCAMFLQLLPFSWKSTCFVCSSCCFITHVKGLCGCWLCFVFNYCFKNTIIFNINCHYKIEPGSLYSQHQADDCHVSKGPKPKFLWHDQTKLGHGHCFSHCDGKLEEERLVVEDEEAFKLKQENITLGYLQNCYYLHDP